MLMYLATLKNKISWEEDSVFFLFLHEIFKNIHFFGPFYLPLEDGRHAGYNYPHNCFVELHFTKHRDMGKQSHLGTCEGRPTLGPEVAAAGPTRFTHLVHSPCGVPRPTSPAIWEWGRANCKEPGGRYDRIHQFMVFEKYILHSRIYMT